MRIGSDTPGILAWTERGYTRVVKRSSSRHDVHARRRARFFDAMGEGVAVFFGSKEAAFGHDIAYRYRPDPDLFYLTGFPEPDAVAVLDGGARRFTLFV